mmetsp:Transcript_10205/g.17137  ORF Transcript_10205/g.17137 Transcript_10205/m.17137 type:complete len:227 (+) Transcript_10205:719-1399(+)
MCAAINEKQLIDLHFTTSAIVEYGVEADDCVGGKRRLVVIVTQHIVRQRDVDNVAASAQSSGGARARHNHVKIVHALFADDHLKLTIIANERRASRAIGIHKYLNRIVLPSINTGKVCDVVIVVNNVEAHNERRVGVTCCHRTADAAGRLAWSHLIERNRWTESCRRLNGHQLTFAAARRRRHRRRHGHRCWCANHRQIGRTIRIVVAHKRLERRHVVLDASHTTE